MYCVLARWYLTTDFANSKARYLTKSQRLGVLTSIQFEHGADRFPQQPIDNYYTAHKYLKELYGMHQDTDCGSIITRASYSTATDTNAIFASCPQFYVGMDLTSSGMNSGLDLTNSRLVFRTQSDATANLYCQLFVWYSLVIQVMAPGDVKVYSA